MSNFAGVGYEPDGLGYEPDVLGYEPDDPDAFDPNLIEVDIHYEEYLSFSRWFIQWIRWSSWFKKPDWPSVKETLRAGCPFFGLFFACLIMAISIWIQVAFRQPDKSPIVPNTATSPPRMVPTQVVTSFPRTVPTQVTTPLPLIIVKLTDKNMWLDTPTGIPIVVPASMPTAITQRQLVVTIQDGTQKVTVTIQH